MGGYLCNQRRLGTYEPEGQVSMCAMPRARTRKTSNSLWSRKGGRDHRHEPLIVPE